MLYPQENREDKKLESFCKRCDFVGEAEAGFEYVYQKQIIKTAEYVARAFHVMSAFSLEIRLVRRNHLAKVKDDVVFDPTLPRNKTAACKSCGHKEAVYMQAPPNRTDERMHLIFVCTKCRHKWQS